MRTAGGLKVARSTLVGFSTVVDSDVFNQNIAIGGAVITDGTAVVLGNLGSLVNLHVVDHVWFMQSPVFAH